ncbi:RNA polymerase sigma factor [Ferruginibacter sp. SUN002]|uniref:RNA polymerase sigma factor n=1 Tax=Ferruginibacter sp. SUN002 TaxID=2937789 RepID=UPI003D363CBB
MSQHQFDHINDNQLLEHFHADKDNRWLGILLQRYTLLLLGVCMKYLKNEDEAKDAVQQVFLKAITELQKYKVDYFKSWLYTVAKNHCLMKLRDKGKYSIELNEKVNGIAEETMGTSIFEKDKALNAMEMALEQLNDDQKQCVTLFYLKKKSYQEITEQTGYTLLQVKSHIQNGKRNLKILMLQMQKNE